MLRLESIRKAFASDGYRTVALDGVSLEFASAGLTLVTGSNGSGKSTLLNVAAGSVAPESGRVYFRGEDITDVPESKRSFVGRVYQSTADGLCLDMTIRENLCLAQIANGMPSLRLAVTAEKSGRIRDAIVELTPGAGLEARLDEEVRHLSGGQAQLVGILFLMLRRPAPSLILADEPTNNLDPANANRCIHLLKTLSERAGVVMVTHDPDVYALGDRMVVMHAGRVATDVSGHDVTSIDPMVVVRDSGYQR